MCVPRNTASVPVPTVQRLFHENKRKENFILQLPSKVYYEKAPEKRGERVPQHLKVCYVLRARFTAGDTMVEGGDVSLTLMRRVGW